MDSNKPLGKGDFENLLPWLRTVKLCLDHITWAREQLPPFAREYLDQMTENQYRLHSYMNGQLLAADNPQDTQGVNNG